MVSPPIHFFRFGHFCGVRRASGRASFVSGNVSDSLSDGIEKYLLPRYLDARDRAQYSSSGGGASRIFHPASLPMSIEIFRRWLRAVSKFLNSGKLRSFNQPVATPRPLADNRSSYGDRSAHGRKKARENAKRVDRGGRGGGGIFGGIVPAGIDARVASWCTLGATAIFVAHKRARRERATRAAALPAPRTHARAHARTHARTHARERALRASDNAAR